MNKKMILNGGIYFQSFLVQPDDRWDEYFKEISSASGQQKPAGYTARDINGFQSVDLPEYEGEI